MKKILCILALIATITSGCDISGRSIFGQSLFGREGTVVEVKRGDTLYGIAKKHNISAQTIISLNKLIPPYNLYVGQSLILSNSPSNAQGHIVRKGDTLYAVAKKYDIPLRDLIETNRLSPPYGLEVGQKLIIPNNRYHIVEKGDTLYSISRKYSVDVTSLSRTNDLKAPYNISVGDKLTLPGSISSTNYSSPRTSSTTNTTSSSRSASGHSNYQSSYSPPASAKRSTKFAWPVKGSIISHYGTLGKGRKNDGINIRATAGTAVNAADKGIVVYAGNELKGFGNLILIKHSDGWITAYAHNERIFVRKGQSVRKGEKISAVGNTGGVNEPQLHFEIHVNKKPINPMPYLQ